MQIFWCEETIFLRECKRLTCMQLNQSVRKNFCGVQSLTCWAPKDVIAVLTLCPERAFISACLIMYCCHGLIKYLLFFYLLTSCVFFPPTLYVGVNAHKHALTNAPACTCLHVLTHATESLHCCTFQLAPNLCTHIHVLNFVSRKFCCLKKHDWG